MYPALPDNPREPEDNGAASRQAADIGDVGDVRPDAARPRPPPSRPNRGDIEAYRAAFKRAFGEALSFEEAAEQAGSLVRLMRLVYRPVTYTQLADVLRAKQERTRSGIIVGNEPEGD